jgi:pimeloyl-ACP methyl ester carboxylesterase
MSRRELTNGNRTYAISDDGPADGPAILYHHGTPAAGIPLQRWVDDAVGRGARLIGYDRPGYGATTRQPERSVADAATDAEAIMDALGIERCATWGISGGGPHALACAALLPDRILGAASLASPTPFTAPGLNYFRGMGTDNIVEFGLALAGREYLEPYLGHSAAATAGASPAELTELLAALVSPPDREVLSGDFGEYWASILATTFAQGAAGDVDDDLAFVKPWGFELDQIQVPLLILHGEQDLFVPIDHGRWLASAIPGAETWISRTDGHLTLMTDRVPDVHEWLLRLPVADAS